MRYPSRTGRGKASSILRRRRRHPRNSSNCCGSGLRLRLPCCPPHPRPRRLRHRGTSSPQPMGALWPPRPAHSPGCSPCVTPSPGFSRRPGPVSNGCRSIWIHSRRPRAIGNSRQKTRSRSHPCTPSSPRRRPMAWNVTGTVGRPSSLPFTPCWATRLLRRPLHRSLRDPAPLPPAGVSYRQRILAVLPTLPASLTTQHVAERTGLTPEAVRKVLPRLVTNREVRRVKPGRSRKPRRRPLAARTERQKANAQRHVETAEPATPSR